jgi:hypothetical protein
MTTQMEPWITTHVKHILKIVFLFFTSWYPMVITSGYRPVNYVYIYLYMYTIDTSTIDPSSGYL